MTFETHSFQAEVQQLMNLMIHSLYSNKEIFLRELISNASDAIDKIRFEEIVNQNLLKSEHTPSVILTANPEAKTLVIEDNGIGMTKEELIKNLGTIANSGTKKFLEKLSEQDKKDANMIGQFGVGFYSVFMVAEKIVVETRSAHADNEAYRWTSTGQGSYDLETCDKQTRGTRVIIHLKDDEKEFAEDWRIRSVVQKYSNYVTYPIFLNETKTVEVEENKESEVPTEEKQAKTETKVEQVRLNQSTPVWARAKRENKSEDYVELYKQISKDWRDPLVWEHINSEGLIPFQSVVYIPTEAPFDLYTRDNHGLHLYVKRVSISEKCKELLPEYLRFVSGVVETDDLPLNVSREILQQNNKLPQIKKQIVKKLLNSLNKLAEKDAEKYFQFYNVFGAVLKEGFHFDHEQHAVLSELVRFKSTSTGKDGWVSLAEYLARKVEGQKDIYYVTGSSFEAVEKSPHLETLLARGIEVLFLVDPIDEWFLMSYPKHGEATFKSINKGDLDLSGIGSDTTSEQNQTAEATPEELAGLIDLFRTHLSANIKEVRISKRLKESACCLVADVNDMSSHLERMMRATGQAMPAQKKILEINPSHPLIKNLAAKKNKEIANADLNEWVDVIYDTALLAEGNQIQNPGVFAKKLTKMMELASHH